jgi:hypothetical protein
MNRNIARGAFHLVIPVLLTIVLFVCKPVTVNSALSAPFTPYENAPPYSAAWTDLDSANSEATLPQTQRLPSLHRIAARFSLLFLVPLLVCMPAARKTTFARKNRQKNNRVASQCYIGHPQQAPPVIS